MTFFHHRFASLGGVESTKESLTLIMWQRAFKLALSTLLLMPHTQAIREDCRRGRRLLSLFLPSCCPNAATHFTGRDFYFLSLDSSGGSIGLLFMGKVKDSMEVMFSY